MKCTGRRNNALRIVPVRESTTFRACKSDDRAWRWLNGWEKVDVFLFEGFVKEFGQEIGILVLG